MKPEENKHEPSDVLGLATHLLGHHATTVVDAGARWGAREAWWRLYPLASLVGFEPDPGECQRLNQLAQDAKAEQYVAAAAGKVNGKATLHVAFEPACSSLYPPDAAVIERYPQCREIREISTEEVPVKTLDTWWGEAGKPDVSFVKLTGSGRLFWGNAVYFRDYVAISDEKKLLILGALLEAVGDRDGAAASLKRISSMDVRRSIIQLQASS